MHVYFPLSHHQPDRDVTWGVISLLIVTVTAQGLHRGSFFSFRQSEGGIDLRWLFHQGTFTQNQRRT